MYDANLLSINASVTKTTNGSALKIRGTGVEGMAMRFYIPSTGGTTTQFLPSVQASHDNSTWLEVARYPGGAQSWASGAKQFIVPFSTTKKYVRAVATITGTTIASNFGTVQAGLTLKVGGDWERSVNFSG